MDFSIQAKDANSQARCAELRLNDSTVPTPAFMPCASRAVLRACDSADLERATVNILCCNAFHLWQRPGHKIVQKLGGLHRLMDWNGGILTDSGGFQVFSIADRDGVGDDGVQFRSPVDGSKLFLTPELSIEIQNSLGADIAMVFDECVDHPAEHDYVAQSVQRNADWAKRSKAAHDNPDQSLFGIVQGGMHPDLRKQSAQRTMQIGFDGYAIGGVSVGEEKQAMLEMIDICAEALPAGAPRYAMGVGTPQDIFDCVTRGVDLFDCVLPTRMARHGSLLTDCGTIRIKNAQYRTDTESLDADCDCPACRRYSRAYLHHLFRADEVSSWRLLSLHNLYFYMDLMTDLRQAIAAGTIAQMATEVNAWTERDRAHQESNDDNEYQ